MKIKILIYFLACLLEMPNSACAATCTGVNPVIVTATILSFGNYDASSASATNANATITAACTVQLNNMLPSFSVSISAGNSGSFTARQMNLLTARLNYNIYTSSAYNTVWGDGTGASVTQPYAASDGLTSKSFTAFGQMPGRQFVTAGLYADTLTITVSY